MSSKLSIPLLFISALFMSFHSHGSTQENNTDDRKSQFKQVQLSFKQALADGNRKAAIEYAEDAAELATVLYGADAKNTVITKYNLATLLANGHDTRQQANQLLLSLEELFSKLYGKDSVEHIDLYLLLGRTSSGKVSAKYYKRMISVASKYKEQDPVAFANIQIQAGNALLLLGDKASKGIKSGYKYLIDNLEITSENVIVASHIMIKYHYVRKEYSKAIEVSERIMPAFGSFAFDHPYELQIRALMVDLLEKKGLSDKATEHCVAIGNMRPWDSNQEQTPLFRVNPVYPLSKARIGKTGWVLLSFDITPSGTVKEIEIIDSEGGISFETESIKALQRWRYAPKFEDGIAVTAKNNKVQLDFSME